MRLKRFLFPVLPQTRSPSRKGCTGSLSATGALSVVQRRNLERTVRRARVPRLRCCQLDEGGFLGHLQAAGGGPIYPLESGAPYLSWSAPGAQEG